MRTAVGLLAGLLVAVSGFAQDPSVAENGVLNAASFATVNRPGHAVAPGSLVSIFGSELAAGLTQADSIPLSTSLGGVTVRFNDTVAPLLFVSVGQVNAQLPWGLLPAGTDSGTTTVTITRDGRSSAPRQFPLATFSPGIFTFPGNGMGPAVVVNASDGSVAQSSGTVQGVTNRPARPGEVILIFANGLGPVNPPVESGAASMDTLRRTVTTPTVLIGGREAEVQFSGLTPQFVGVNQLNVVVPSGLTAASAVPVQLRIGGITTTDLATMAIGN